MSRIFIHKCQGHCKPLTQQWVEYCLFSIISVTAIVKSDLAMLRLPFGLSQEWDGSRPCFMSRRYGCGVWLSNGVDIVESAPVVWCIPWSLTQHCDGLAQHSSGWLKSESVCSRIRFFCNIQHVADPLSMIFNQSWKIDFICNQKVYFVLLSMIIWFGS
jgi:hypothetical protein